MRFVSMRRAVPACLATAAALALTVPGVASAKKAAPPKTDVNEQCSGPKVDTNGSTFQAPLMYIWTGVNSSKGNELLDTGYNHSSDEFACSGSKKAEVYDNQEERFRGSGACLKALGEGVGFFGEPKTVDGVEETFPHVNKFPLCGTDEAPKQSVKETMEGFADHAAGFESGEGKAIESLPVAQGSEAIIVHLPKGCLAKSEITTSKGKTEKLGRLALDQEVIEEIYRGTITTWNQALAKQGSDGSDVMTCENEAAKEDTIRPVVRADKSGTTHIFKAFLLQVYTGTTPMEEFKEVNKGEKPCKEGKLEAGAVESWQQVSEGCENQRWPLAAHVLRPTETGNPGVVNEVNNTESSIGYADLAVAAERGFFSGLEKENEMTHKKEMVIKGGENKKGEQNEEFWAVVQNSEPGASPVTFEDPATGGDTVKVKESNCKDTVYESAIGTPFPPESTRDDWSKVKGANVSVTYPICGVTYVLAPRQEYYFLQPYGASEEEAKAIATSVHDFLQFVTAKKGGQAELKGSDYAALPKNVQEEDAIGAEEIGSKEA